MLRKSLLIALILIMAIPEAACNAFRTAFTKAPPATDDKWIDTTGQGLNN